MNRDLSCQNASQGLLCQLLSFFNRKKKVQKTLVEKVAQDLHQQALKQEEDLRLHQKEKEIRYWQKKQNQEHHDLNHAFFHHRDHRGHREG